METILKTYTITTEQTRNFLNFSYDQNLLHWDQDYAYRTQFRKPICFGMSTVIFALGVWANGRFFSLTKIKGDFKKPIFPNEPFEIEIQEEGQAVTLQCKSDGQTLTKISFEWQHYTPGRVQVVESTFVPVDHARSFNPESLEPIEEYYQPNWREIEKSISTFNLKLNQLPFHQLASFLWASYCVGMKYPGAQALFSNFNFTYNVSNFDSESILIKKLNFNFHPTFQLLTLSNEKNENFHFKIQAFVRPVPVQYPMKEIALKVAGNQQFKNKVVFISGGTRGFGSVLAKLFLLQGAKVIVSYLHSTQDAIALENEVRELGYKIDCIKADLSTKEGSAYLQKEMQSRYGYVDIVINNASPVISPIPANQQKTPFTENFIRDSISIYTNTSRVLIPMMKEKNGMVISVSSNMVKLPNPLFSHYIEAKLVIEKNTRSLADENPNIQFVVVRPPKMLTDQTNATGSVDVSASAVDIAFKLFSELKNNRDRTNLLELEL